MEKGRALGLLALLLGLGIAILARVADSAAAGALAAMLLVGGGLVLWLSFREAAGRSDGTGRLSLLVASRRPRPHEPVISPELTAFAGLLDGVLGSCRALLARSGEVSTDEVAAARDRLVELIASPSYTRAIAAGLVEEEEVLAVSGRLAKLG